MDIAFHYFAVKTLAVLAGFSDSDAQVIAQSSQMVDDFDFTAYWHCTNVPDEIKHNSDYDLCVAFDLFNPAQTGFLCDGLLGKTDFLNLAIPRFQKFTCSPFHFIPPNRAMIGSAEYRVAPAVLGDGSLASQLLEQAGNEYRAAQGDTQRHRKLMKLGVLLHIFADTAAHQLFSGWNAKVNFVSLVNVTNNITQADETAAYKSVIQVFLDILMKWAPQFTPAIGHMMVEHIPDLSHLSFTMEYTGENGQKCLYTRNNTEKFLQMSRQILHFLCDCNGTLQLEEERWQQADDILRRGFLTDISKDLNQRAKVTHLKTAWIGPDGCTYDYNGEAIKKAFAKEGAAVLRVSPLGANGLERDCLPSATDLKMLGLEANGIGEDVLGQAVLSTKASTDFYDFNRIAEEVLIALYGPHPRRL